MKLDAGWVPAVLGSLVVRSFVAVTLFVCGVAVAPAWANPSRSLSA